MEDLLERMASHDEEVLPEFIAQYSPLIRYVVGPILQRDEEIEECVNDIIFKVWKTINKYDPEKGSFNAWLCTLARNSAIGRMRVKPIATVALDEAIEIPTSEDDQQMEMLYDIVASFPRHERLLFYRYYYYGQSMKQIARETGCTVRSVEGRLYRLKKKLIRKAKHE